MPAAGRCCAGPAGLGAAADRRLAGGVEVHDAPPAPAARVRRRPRAARAAKAASRPQARRKATSSWRRLSRQRQLGGPRISGRAACRRSASTAPGRPARADLHELGGASGSSRFSNAPATWRRRATRGDSCRPKARGRAVSRSSSDSRPGWLRAEPSGGSRSAVVASAGGRSPPASVPAALRADGAAKASAGDAGHQPSSNPAHPGLVAAASSSRLSRSQQVTAAPAAVGNGAARGADWTSGAPPDRRAAWWSLANSQARATSPRRKAAAPAGSRWADAGRDLRVLLLHGATCSM
jgi:hypothetical protein